MSSPLARATALTSTATPAPPPIASSSAAPASPIPSSSPHPPSASRRTAAFTSPPSSISRGSTSATSPTSPTASPSISPPARIGSASTTTPPPPAPPAQTSRASAPPSASCTSPPSPPPPTPPSPAPSSRATSPPGGTVTNGVNSLVNPNQALPPYRSKEWELGFKSAGRPINLTTALFRIERPFANTVPFSATQSIFKISGLQVNYGAEISGQGTLFHHLLLAAGFTALNARLYDTGIAATNGKRFVGIPPNHSNLYSEFRVPHVANLAITGNWEFSGLRPQDDENLHATPGFNIFNLGARYSQTLFTKLAILRFTANNLSDTHYFSTIAAGDITGTNASSNTAHLGSPRTISSSLQFAF